MSSFNKNTAAQRQGVVDYDKQYQEDLERAQALSLESLALEEFKLKKQQAQYTGCKQESRQSSSKKNDNESESEASISSK